MVPLDTNGLFYVVDRLLCHYIVSAAVAADDGLLGSENGFLFLFTAEFHGMCINLPFPVIRQVY